MFEVIRSTAEIVNPQVNSAVNDMLNMGIKTGTLAITALLSWGIKLGISSMKSSWKRVIAQRLVSYASQRLDGSEEKRAYVARKLHEHFPRISEEEASHLLEEAVVNLKASLGTS